MVDLTADELLAPPHGFIWTAQLRMNGVPIRVRDRYFDEQGGVRVELFGFVPIQSDSGANVTRSSRHRLAAEAVWSPSVLLPQDGIRWEAIDSKHVRVVLTIDGEAIPLTLAVDQDGRLQELMMRRWGNVGVEDWQLLPYGFRVEEEAVFDGITIPSRLIGGWWYGTDRFEAATATEFTILEAAYSNEADGPAGLIGAEGGQRVCRVDTDGQLGATPSSRLALDSTSPSKDDTPDQLAPDSWKRL